MIPLMEPSLVITGNGKRDDLYLCELAKYRLLLRQAFEMISTSPKLMSTPIVGGDRSKPPKLSKIL